MFFLFNFDNRLSNRCYSILEYQFALGIFCFKFLNFERRKMSNLNRTESIYNNYFFKVHFKHLIQRQTYWVATILTTGLCSSNFYSKFNFISFRFLSLKQSEWVLVLPAQTFFSSSWCWWRGPTSRSTRASPSSRSSGRTTKSSRSPTASTRSCRCKRLELSLTQRNSTFFNNFYF